MEHDNLHLQATAWLDERYRQVIEQVEDYAIFTLDNEGRVTTWNKGAERVLGYLEEEALGQPGRFIFTPEDRERGAHERELETAQYAGRAVDERWHLRKDGSHFFASGILTALYGERGTTEGFSKILRDLTRPRAAEQERERLLAELQTANESLERQVQERTRELLARTRELEARNEQLRQTQERFAKAFRAGPVAACLTTLGEEHFLEVNDAFAELSGYSREETIGRSHKQLAHWSSPEDLAKLRQFGESPFRNQELTLRTRRGEVKTILLSRELIELGGERVNLKQFYDITERKRGETELIGALERVMADTGWFAQKVMEELARVKVGDAPSGPLVKLSRREREVLERLARGLNNDAIASDLGLSTQTIRNYISALYGKLGVNSRAQAIVWARERGIV